MAMKHARKLNTRYAKLICRASHSETECWKHMAKTSWRHCGMSMRSRRSWSTMTVYERSTPARMPAGGSFVTLVLICSRPSGKSGLGSDVSRLRAQSEVAVQAGEATQIGLGALVDADLARESASLASLQVRQQLSNRSIGIANQAPSALLGLLR